MKNLIITFIGLLLLFFCDTSINKMVAQDKSATENTISIACTSDLYNLTNNWTIEFCKLNPDIKIKVVKSTDSKPSNILNIGPNLCFISNEAFTVLDNKELWKMKVGKDALVPIINSKNPFLSEIKKQNISPVILAQILANPGNRKWNVLPKIAKNQPINYYLTDDQSNQSMIAKFLSSNHTIEGIRVENDEKMITAIAKDPYSIGFCKLSNLINSNNPNIYANISIMPIDKNGNGKIDDFENVYVDLQTFMRKAWIGQFPVELTGNIYSVSTQTPANQTEIAFLEWVSTDGQQFLNQNSYSTLVLEEKQSNLATLGIKKDFVAVKSDSFKVSAFQVGFALFIVLLIGIILLMTLSPKQKATEPVKSYSPGIFDENSLLAPIGLYFDKTHTWAFMEKDGKVRIGIDDFIQHVTGPLTKVKMKNPGEKVTKGEPVLSIIQNGKLLNINSPVSGTILEQNEILSTEPSTINQSPFSNGWVYMIEPTNWLREIQFFTMAEKYKEWIKNEFSRLKDFLSITLNSKMPEYAPVVLQDGGTIKDHVLADLGPEVWEEFQTNFVDTMK
jgi:glycine cleavage system H lipoate-binding protein/ABC-type phosphate transport system substrate-binding protein